MNEDNKYRAPKTGQLSPEQERLLGEMCASLPSHQDKHWSELVGTESTPLPEKITVCILQEGTFGGSPLFRAYRIESGVLSPLYLGALSVNDLQARVHDHFPRREIVFI